MSVCTIGSEVPAGAEVLWKPHPGPQTYVLSRPEYEIGYGGARGGGKTDAGIIWMAEPVEEFSMYRGLVIRRNAEDLKDWTDRAWQIYQHFGAKMTGKPPEFKFPSGAIIRTGHLKDENAFEKYQGHEYQRMEVEELGQIAAEINYLKLIASCRSTVPGLDPQVFTTWNWGGAGHSWIRKRFYDPAPPGTPFKDPISGRGRIFIPAKIEDNPTLMEADPDYVHYLDSLPEPLRSAWRHGDPDAFAGQYFKPWYRKIHIIDPFGPFEDPEKWAEGGYVCMVGIDPGYHHPFCAEYLAVDTDGNHYFYRELHGQHKDVWYWGDAMLAAVEEHEPIIGWATGHDAWARAVMSRRPGAEMPSSKCEADAWSEMGIPVFKANNSRVPGWHRMLALLDWHGESLPGGEIDFNKGGKRPQMYLIKGACPVLESQFESAISDESKREDVRKPGRGEDSDDDGLEAGRYATMHAIEAVATVPPKPLLQQQIDKLMGLDDERKVYGGGIG